MVVICTDLAIYIKVVLLDIDDKRQNNYSYNEIIHNIILRLTQVMEVEYANHNYIMHVGKS